MNALLLPLLLLAPSRDQTYVVPITDYALVASIKSLFDGEPLIEGLATTPKLGLSTTSVIKMLKEHDVEFMLRARPAWRADGDRLKHARGFYEVRIYLWEQFGPLAGLDYRVRLTEEGGAKTTVNSHIELNVRRFGPRHGDRLLLAVANIPIVHRLINKVAERAVHAAEYGILHGVAVIDEMRRDHEREQRRNMMSGKFKSMDDNKTIMLEDGTTHEVADSVSVSLNSKSAKLTDLKSGDSVNLFGRPVTSVSATR